MTPETTARLLALPSLRRQAESTFRERRNASAELLRSHGKFNFAELIEDDEDVATSIEVETALLADITRWQSQAWALRRIANKLGWSIGGRVPDLECVNGAYEIRCVCELTNAKGIRFEGVLQRAVCIPIHGMSRPEAIAAILLHVEEA